ncbi:MAG: dihydrodipicolinate synthase family protein [Rhizobiales bacterium]|nr:dihydrodipicolinate synthase family protein [Hyphomicrobiales bacterium]
MPHTDPLSGVFAPVLTPFTPRLAPDRTLFVRFCHWLIGQGVGLAVFGTNSEANSLSVEEKLDLLAALLDAGIAPERLMPGTGACAIPDAVRLSSAAARAGTAAALMLPPFYYKGVSEDGVFAYYADVIERVGNQRFRICLYHIPHLSGVAITRTLIARLIARYPKTVVGIKDSGGDFANTRAMLDEFPGFRVFCGSETFLTETLAHGGAGCISAAANVNPAAILQAFLHAGDSATPTRQTGLNAVRKALEQAPMIASLKRCVAHYGQAPGFARPRPPLIQLDDDAWARVSAALDQADFSMPGLAAALSSNS